MTKRSGKRVMPMRSKLGSGGSKNQLQKLQEDFARMQEEMKDKTTTVSVGGGVVTVVVTGEQKIKELRIAPEVVDPEDVEMLQDLILAAVNDALDKSQSAMAEQLSGLTGPIGLDGLL